MTKEQREEARKAMETLREYCQRNRYCDACPLLHGGYKTCDINMPCDWSFNDEMQEV